MWLVSVCLLACLLVGSEVYWRVRNFHPSIVDTKMLWSIHRSRVYGDKKIVILGASRAQSGIDPDVLKQAFPDYDVIQLAVAAAKDHNTLKDLAEDPAFTGIILCSVKEQWFLPSSESLTKPRVDFYHDDYHRLSHLEDRIVARIHAFLQSYLVIFSPELTIRKFLELRSPLYPSHQYMTPDRYRPTFFRKMIPPERLESLRQRKADWVIRTLKPASRRLRQTVRRAVTEELARLYRNIRQRGGDLVLIRMPSSGEYWQAEQRSFPKQQFWDNIGAWTGVPTIHFKDYLELSQYECPDLSHMDAKDAHQFTRDLAGIIKQKIPGIE